MLRHLLVIGVDQSIPVDEVVESCGNTYASIRGPLAQAFLEKVRVRGVHLQAHDALSARSPAALAHDPAEDEHAHALDAVSPDAVLVRVPSARKSMFCNECG